MARKDGRKSGEIRKVRILRDYLKYPEGSVLIEVGDTRVVCAASVAEDVPHHRKGTGLGWVTAEYAMLPRSTAARMPREHFHRPRGRTYEIQRIIGRSLRAVVDFKKLGERSVYIDADVIQADGGTRTAAITGCFVALYDALTKLKKEGKIKTLPIKDFLAAVSVGIVQGEAILDLTYDEDSRAEVDMNIVMTDKGEFVEIQGTAESKPFSDKTLLKLLELAKKGTMGLIEIQKKVLLIMG